MGAADADLDRRYLLAALGLIVSFMLAELVVSIVTGSLALLADAGHQLADAGALGGSLLAMRLASRPATDLWTFGFQRAEILSAAFNGVTLVVVAALVTAESVRRLIAPSAVHPVGVIAVAACGFLVNVAATTVLSRASRRRLDVRGAIAHLVTDIWGTAGALAAGIAILVTGYERADAIASLVVVCIMGRTALSLLASSGRVLFEAAPEGLRLAEVRVHLLEAPHVRGIHDLHAWLVSSGLPALSAHVVVDEACFTDGHAPLILDELQACLAGHFDLEHSTFQLEPPGHSGHEAGSHEGSPLSR